MKPLYRTILILLVILFAAILIIFQFTNQQAEIDVQILIPDEAGQIGVYGPVGLQFSQPMDQASVESHITIAPKMPGRFEWVENTVWFFPEMPLDQVQGITLSLRAGARSAEGESLNKSLDSSFSIRTPEVLYLVLDQSGGDLWRWNATSQTSAALTDTGGAVIDFAPNRTGERIVYAAVNAEGGSDLWVVDREGKESAMLLDCGLDYCSQPVWSQDSARIAYARQVRSASTGLLQPSQIWTVSLDSTATSPLSEDANGHSPSFSPNGRWLGFYDTAQGAIRVLGLEASQEILIPTSMEEMGDWSPDGRSLLFIDLIPSALEPEVGLYIADLENNTVQRALEGESDGTSFSQPRYSPDAEWIAVSLRAVNDTAAKALWVLNLNGKDINLIANEPATTYSAYHWNPSGYQLVYQSLDTGSANFRSQIWLWHWGKDESQLIVENGARPVWLP